MNDVGRFLRTMSWENSERVRFEREETSRGWYVHSPDQGFRVRGDLDRHDGKLYRRRARTRISERELEKGERRRTSTTRMLVVP